MFPCKLASPPSCSQQPTKQQQRMKGKQMAESVCFLVLGHLPCSLGRFFEEVITLLHAKTFLAARNCCHLLAAWWPCRGTVGFKPLRAASDSQ